VARDASVLEELLVLGIQADLRGFVGGEGQGSEKDREQELHEKTGPGGAWGVAMSADTPRGDKP
jgi:hypothetical protein